MKLNRRGFLGAMVGTSAMLGMRATQPEAVAMQEPDVQVVECPVWPVTSGPKYHYFGYYDKHCWDATQRYILGLEVDFYDRSQEADDVAVIGLIDTDNDNTFVPVGSTSAWNW
ncbi:MAG: hypothetical protein GF320_04595, partial [Armatimonadia bacterium]|nr:hypothetical protein [Armatimonadia bacterium]